MQNSATPKLRAFARQLLSCEAAPGKPAAARDAAVFRVCEKLRQSLSKVMGVAGFHALLARALVLARADVSWLMDVRIKTDGSLEGLIEVEATLQPNELALGEIALVAQILGLLVRFIGPALTLALLREAWPEAAFSEADFAE
jgi:hypothetical protein